MNDLEWPMLSYYVVYYEKFRKAHAANIEGSFKNPHGEHLGHPYKSHDHDHQWADLVMTWLPKDKWKYKHKVVKLVWDFDCLHFAQYISISQHVNRPDEDLSHALS